MQCLEIDAKHLDVDVFWFQSEQPIAYAAADDARTSDATHGLQYVDQRLRQMHG